jgi:hypothetical protein
VRNIGLCKGGSGCHCVSNAGQLEEAISPVQTAEMALLDTGWHPSSFTQIGATDQKVGGSNPSERAIWA